MNRRPRDRRHAEARRLLHISLSLLLASSACARMLGIGDTVDETKGAPGAGALGVESGAGGSTGSGGDGGTSGGSAGRGGSAGEGMAGESAAGEGGSGGSGGSSGTAGEAGASGATTLPRAYEPRGAVRADNVNHVVFAGADGHIHELHLAEGTWWWTDLTLYSGAPEGSAPFTHTRTDQTTSIVYRSTTNRVIELYLPLGGEWRWGDLTRLAGASANAGAPVAYVRDDGASAVLYQDTTSGHLHELSLSGGAWHHVDLTTATGAPTEPVEIRAFQRSDGINSILCSTSNGSSYEVYGNDGDWSWRSLGTTAYDASGYVRADGLDALIFRDAADHLHELTLEAGEWDYDNDLTSFTGTPTVWDPLGLRGPRGSSSVVFQADFDGGVRHVHEIHLADGVWYHSGDLTALTGCANPASSSRLSVYARSDRLTSVLFDDENGDIYELSTSGSTWSCRNLSDVAF